MIFQDILFSVEVLAAVATLAVMARLLLDLPALVHGMTSERFSLLHRFKSLFSDMQGKSGYYHYRFDVKRSLLNQHVAKRA